MQKYYELGERALAEHRYVEAERAYLKLKQLAPGTSEVFGRLGLVYFQERKFEEAVPALRHALKLKPGLPNTDLLLAVSLSELGQYEEALPTLEKGFKHNSDLPLKRMSGLQLLRLYTDLHRDSKAVETALEMNRLFPDDPEVLYHTSRIYANFAYVNLHRLSEVAPSSVWRQQAAAEADESQGNLDLAITEYRQVLASDPGRRGIHYRIGRVLLSQARAGQSGSQSDALSEFELELQLDPTNADAAYEAAGIYRKSGHLDKAEALLLKALESYPTFEEAQVGLGGVEIALHKPDVAISHLQAALALMPEDEVAYYRLSQAYSATGNAMARQRALAEFRRLRDRKAEQRDSTSGLSQPGEVTKQEIDDPSLSASQIPEE